MFFDYYRNLDDNEIMITEKDDCIILDLFLPGWNADEDEITVDFEKLSDSNTLIIEGKTSGKRYCTDFKKKYVIKKGWKPTDVTLTNGVMTIHLEKDIKHDMLERVFG